MAEKVSKLSVKNIREYLQKKKNNIIQDISVIAYVTKPSAGEAGVDPRTVVYTDPNSHISEQYRSLRTNLTALSPEKPIRSFTVTSALRGEGKTITVSNLAMAYSQDVERKTILIDADLRKPRIHQIFSLPKTPGLTDILRGEADLEKFIKEPVVENLFIVPGGRIPANPVELLSSSRMQDIINRMKEKFDCMIFDVAPILAVTDAGVLGCKLDGTIIVVRASRTQAVDVEKAYSLLIEANANPLGSVLTGVVTYIPYYLYRYRYMYTHHYYGA